MKFNPSKSVRSPIVYAMFSSSISRLVLRSVAEKSICAVAVRVLAFRSASSPINSLALPMRAFDFRVRAFAPRLSHSISLCTRFSKASWRLDWACRNSSFFSRNSL